MKTWYLLVFALLFVCYKTEAFNDTIMVSPDDTLLLVCIKAETNLYPVQVQHAFSYEDSNKVVCSISQADDISALTLAVNTVNNAMTDMNNLFTVVTIIIGVVTLLVAVVGLLGFHDVRKDVNEHKKKVNIEIDVWRDTWKKETEILNKKNEKLERIQSLNNQYSQRLSTWILSNTYAIAEAKGGSTEQGRKLMEKSILNYYLMKLYLSKDKHEIDGCINYIKMKGGKEEIEHLQFIVDNDLDKDKINKASKAIGYIQGRLSSN